MDFFIIQNFILIHIDSCRVEEQTLMLLAGALEGSQVFNLDIELPNALPREESFLNRRVR
jgi:hypothetical protein